MTQLDHRPWSQDFGEDCLMGLKSDHEFSCLFCGTKMVIHNAKLMAFSLTDSEEKDSKAIDVVLTCMGCGYVDIYGVAISEEHWAKTEKKFIKHMETNPHVFTKKGEDERPYTEEDPFMEKNE